MSGADGGRLSRRGLCCVLAGLAACAATPRLALGQDAAGAIRDLTDSSDFRVRVSAALYLGRTHPPGAREALEHSLGDAHPAVRVAAATALGSLGDPSAIPAMARREGAEPSASVKAQLQSSIDQLRRAAVTGDPAGADPHKLAPNVRYVVRLGAMRNPSGVRGEDLRRVLLVAARSRARALHGTAIVDADAALLAQATERHLPVLTLDGSVMQLTEARVEGSVQVQARVEFAVRREQTLKGTLSGAATTFGSGQIISDQGRRQLQDDAVDGAVQSALRGADQGLMIAAL
ncbi:MAG TPA: HEAT repeat domain-containing protein [Polyangiaceae bacterium]|nr:HEAT repeat domain-containing protein [Polyangiaceae bacterium]